MLRLKYQAHCKQKQAYFLRSTVCVCIYAVIPYRFYNNTKKKEIFTDQKARKQAKEDFGAGEAQAENKCQQYLHESSADL